MSEEFTDYEMRIINAIRNVPEDDPDYLYSLYKDGKMTEEEEYYPANYDGVIPTGFQKDDYIDIRRWK